MQSAECRCSNSAEKTEEKGMNESDGRTGEGEARAHKEVGAEEREQTLVTKGE